MVISLYCCIFASQVISRENLSMLYCCKDYKNVKRDKKFIQRRFFVCFPGIASFILKHQRFFKLKARTFHFSKHKTFFSEWVPFIFWAWKVISRNIKISFGASVSRNIRKAFFWESIRNFVILEYKKFYRGGFFYFSGLGWKVPFPEI